MGGNRSSINSMYIIKKDIMPKKDGYGFLTFLYPLFIVFSAIKHYSYYSEYGINIFEYMELSEFLSLAFGDYLLYGLGLLFFIFLAFLDGYLNDHNDFRISVDKTYIWGLISIFLIVCALSLWNSFHEGRPFLYSLFMFIVTFAVFVHMLVNLIGVWIGRVNFDDKGIRKLILIILLGALSFYYYGKEKAREAGQHLVKINIYFDRGSVLLNDKQNFYLGKTKSNYFFVYKGYTHILPVTKIKEVVVLAKR